MGLFGSKKRKEIQAKEMEIIFLNQEMENLQKQNEILKSENELLKSQLLPEHNEIADLKKVIEELNKEIFDKNQELQSFNNQILYNQQRVSDLENKIYQLNSKLAGLNEEIDMLDYGLYSPTYKFANSDLYKDELANVRGLQKEMIKNKRAATGGIGWTVNGDKTQGRKMVSDMQKLLLRAFNLECDDIIAHVKLSNREKSATKIHDAANSISKLGNIMNVSINYQYVDLKIKELNLAIDYVEKKEEEKERIRELKAQEREAKKAQKEIEDAKKKLEKEHTHYSNALMTIYAKLKKNPNDKDLLAKKTELEDNLAETEKAIEDVDYRQANQRAGYVYVISNIGAFGENVYKIGMTRRLEPMERIRELGNASVPFNFDVHALIFTEDAPKLESALHTAFAKRKVNKINHRREFFNVSLDEIKQVIRNNFDKTVEWFDVPEAEQYRQSIIIAQLEQQNNL